MYKAENLYDIQYFYITRLIFEGKIDTAVIHITNILRHHGYRSNKVNIIRNMHQKIAKKLRNILNNPAIKKSISKIISNHIKSDNDLQHLIENSRISISESAASKSYEDELSGIMQEIMRVKASMNDMLILDLYNLLKKPFAILEKYLIIKKYT